jgi:flagellar motility protein MotE (MotC chaperone)
MRRFLPLRLLPVTVLAVVGLLFFKVQEAYDGFHQLQSLVPFGTSEAKAQAAAPKAAAGKPGADAAKGTEIAAATPPATAEMPRDPTRFTQGEIDLLQKLSERREALDKRERELEQREAMLRAAEKRFDEKVSELEGLKTQLRSLVDQRSKDEEERLRSLVRIYETMKPKEAAQILEKLDLDVVVGVIGRMKETKLAPSLASMLPERAKTLTSLLVDRSRDQPPAPPPAGAAPRRP